MCVDWICFSGSSLMPPTIKKSTACIETHFVTRILFNREIHKGAKQWHIEAIFSKQNVFEQTNTRATQFSKQNLEHQILGTKPRTPTSYQNRKQPSRKNVYEKTTEKQLVELCGFVWLLMDSHWSPWYLTWPPYPDLVRTRPLVGTVIMPDSHMVPHGTTWYHKVP